MAVISEQYVAGFLLTDGILQPKLVNRWRLKELEGMPDDKFQGLLVQAVAISYKENRPRNKCLITLIIEDDVVGHAAEAVSLLGDHKFLKVQTLDGNESIHSEIVFKRVNVVGVSYELDYAESATCKYVITLVSEGPYHQHKFKKDESLDNA